GREPLLELLDGPGRRPRAVPAERGPGQQEGDAEDPGVPLQASPPRHAQSPAGFMRQTDYPQFPPLSRRGEKSSGPRAGTVDFRRSTSEMNRQAGARFELVPAPGGEADVAPGAAADRDRGVVDRPVAKDLELERQALGDRRLEAPPDRAGESE